MHVIPERNLMRNLLPRLLVFAAAAFTLAAHADTLDATLTGGSHTFIFTLPSQFSFPNQIHLVTVPPVTTTGTADGVANQTFDLTFFTGIADPGQSLIFSDITNGLSFTFGGPILISPGADPNAPANFLTADIATGTFNLTAPSPKGDPILSTLTIAQPSDPAPEPSTLLLLGTGMIGLVTCIGRRVAYIHD
jgi:hypothetical protein